MGSNGLRFVIRPVESGSKQNRVVSQLPVSIIMLPGLAMTLCTWFPSAMLSWWALALGMIGLSILLSLLELTERGTMLLFSALALVIGVCLVTQKQVIAGLGCLGNDLTEALTRITGRIYLEFAVSAEGSALWGLLPVAAILVILLQLSIQTGSMVFFLPVLLALYGALLAGLYPMDAGLALIGLGTVILMLRRSAVKTAGQSWYGVPSWIAVILVCGLTGAGISLMVGGDILQENRWEKAIHDFLYDQDSNSMPEGDLYNLSGWNKSETPALEVTMTKPQKVYLRGQIFEVYDGTSWETVDTQALAEYESLFYWLHQWDFYGQSQIGISSALTGQGTLEQMTVENLSACSSHGYYPYAVYGNTVLDQAQIGDAYFLENTLLSYYSGSLPQWYEIQHQLASGQYGEDISRFLEAEASYEAYVTTLDLQLTNESWSVLNRQVGQENGPQTLSQICQFIRSWLEENMVYDEQVKTLNGSTDFLQYTLERSGSGYSVHYATAATLMLRYFGVPARYVEGYYLSAEEAERYQSGQTILLTEEHAHAWAEYYLPGVGFVPFEVTPGYIDAEDLNLGGNQANNEQQYTGDHLKYAQVEQPERLEEPQQDRFHFSMKLAYLLYLLLVLLILLLIFLLLRRKRLRAALLAIDNAPNREAIALRFGYAAALLNRCGGVEVEGFQRSAELNREALFSNHKMTEQQRHEMDDYARRVLKACKGKWTWLERLRYRLWDCLY